MKYTTALEYARQLRKNQTGAEKIFWSKVRNRKFHDIKFTRQYIVEHKLLSATNKYFIVDFFCHSKKLIVEIDGEIHKYQLNEDKDREDILKAYGYRLVRFDNDDIISNWEKVSTILSNNL